MQEIPEGIRLSYASAAFGYAYEKRMELKDSSLSLHYRIENRGGGEFPFLWTFHGLMRYEEDMRLLLPTDFEYYRNVLSHPVLGEEGRVYPCLLYTSIIMDKAQISSIPEINARDIDAQILSLIHI